MKFSGNVSIHFTQRASDLLRKVQSSRFSDSELSRYISEFTLADLEVRTFYLGRLNDNGVIDILVLDHEDRDAIEQLTSYPLSVDLPMNRAIVRNEVTWLDYRVDPFADYPSLQHLEPDFNVKTLVAASIKKSGIPVGSWGVTLKTVIEPSPEWDEFFLLISEIIAARFEIIASQTNSESTSIVDIAPNTELNTREIAVLKILSEGKTNGEIAEALDYSESTIRLITIEIYRKLGVNSRDEAKEYYLKNKVLFI